MLSKYLFLVGLVLNCKFIIEKIVINTSQYIADTALSICLQFLCHVRNANKLNFQSVTLRPCIWTKYKHGDGFVIFFSRCKEEKFSSKINQITFQTTGTQLFDCRDSVRWISIPFCYFKLLFTFSICVSSVQEMLFTFSIMVKYTFV